MVFSRENFRDETISQKQATLILSWYQGTQVLLLFRVLRSLPKVLTDCPNSSRGLLMRVAEIDQHPATLCQIISLYL